MRAIIFGARGMLGSTLVSALPGHGIEVAAALSRTDCDLLDVNQIGTVIRTLTAATGAAVVINAAALTNVDAAEDHADESFAVNALAPEAMARACERAGLAFVHYSTDFVFNGEQERPYDEFDPPSPQGVYARSKAAGEQLVRDATRRAFVLRVGCLYGRGGRNFPSTILRRLQAGETIKADDTRQASPTWVIPVSRVTAALIKTEHFGLYHCTANGETSWADYARFLAERLRLPADRVQSLPTAALAMKAPRPRRAILDKRMLRLRGLDTLGTWQDHARAFLASEGAAVG